MVFFKELSTSLKQKWLEYYQKNRSWLILHMTQQNTVHTPDGGRRPLSYLILGILNALEPELEALMLPFSKLKADADSLIEVLGLDFDPDIAIGKKPDFSLDKSTPMDTDGTGEDVQESPGVNQPLMPDTIEDSDDLGTTAAAAITGAAAVAGGVALAAGLDQDSDDLLNNDQGKSDLELESDDDLDLEIEADDGSDIGLDSDSQTDDELDIGLDSDSQTDDELDIGLDSDSQTDDELDIGLDSDLQADDELDIGLDSDLQADDELDIGLDSDLQADDNLASIDLENLDENSPNNLDPGKDNSNFLAEDIPESFNVSAKLDELGLDELDDGVIFDQDSSDKTTADIDLSELGDDLSSDDLEDFDFDLDGEGLGLDEADLDSLAGDKKSYNDDLEGLLG